MNLEDLYGMLGAYDVRICDYDKSSVDTSITQFHKTC